MIKNKLSCVLYSNTTLYVLSNAATTVKPLDSAIRLTITCRFDKGLRKVARHEFRTAVVRLCVPRRYVPGTDVKFLLSSSFGLHQIAKPFLHR